MRPFVKWPGGKSDEIETIHQHLPENINNYIEPFLGGGACFLSLDNDSYNNAYVNDLSHELIDLYRMISNNNLVFRECLNDIWEFWNYGGELFREKSEEIIDIYIDYRENIINEEILKTSINNIFENDETVILENLPDNLRIDEINLIRELKKSTISKLKNTRKKEIKDGDLPQEDYYANFESGLRAGIYTYYRNIYNSRLHDISNELHIAIFFYIREFCYSSMFRYNTKGGFNVPYGGLSYNNKNFRAKIEYINDDILVNKLNTAEYYNLDFEEFLNTVNINNDDFIFLDPPYDGGFSTYANNIFEQNDQRRLANYLINDCNANFMLIIKNTDFIFNLYDNQENIEIIGFDKEYKVSFMDRNDKSVKHLLIKNY